MKTAVNRSAWVLLGMSLAIAAVSFCMRHVLWDSRA